MDSTEWDEMYSREFEDPRDPSRDYWNSSILALPTGGDAPVSSFRLLQLLQGLLGYRRD